ncbi:MAG: diacylglycerol kinase family lipid kinase [Phaeodactylibacter sp.]|nr:diacylglycerol kinase family lipid kinase [Phaeodactylibacter sp.]MCB9295291.1 diacylglycerol kinase family lipid kinase [Lewinellaceae bacterium]
MNHQWYAIANPTAGKGLVRKHWPALQQRIAQALPVSGFALSEYKGHAIELARQAVENGCRNILAIGGDGTNHEVANGILRQQAAPSRDITYALLPIGTGNDWIRTHGLPKDMDRALALIRAGKTSYQDVGLIHYHKDGEPRQRYFVNVAGLAYDGFIGKKAEERRYATRNKLFYLLLVARCLFEYELRRAVVESNGRREEGLFYTINLGICRYSGGGMQLTPHAVPDDGQFAVTLAGSLSRLGVLLNTYRFYNGSIGGHPKVDTFQAASLTVRAADGEPPTLLEADGEFLGETPARFTILQQALKFIVP